MVLFSHLLREKANKRIFTAFCSVQCMNKPVLSRITYSFILTECMCLKLYTYTHTPERSLTPERLIATSIHSSKKVAFSQSRLKTCKIFPGSASHPTLWLNYLRDRGTAAPFSGKCRQPCPSQLSQSLTSTPASPAVCTSSENCVKAIDLPTSKV